MRESSKTRAIRPPDFAARFLAGRVIDIGAGNDLVCAHAERFDLEDGDANHISRYRPTGAYDCVHASHCLEHMRDARAALRDWWSLLKPGGYLIVVVPDEDLYEQGCWPSVFNGDHKHSFTLKGTPSWSPVSLNPVRLLGELPDCHILDAELHDHHYDYALQRRAPSRAHPWVARKLRKLAEWAGRQTWLGESAQRFVRRLCVRLGATLDQTYGPALAQIQVIARKR
jgi:SAM-dependent methyltransferase